MQRIYVPCDGAEKWKEFLADPGHWRTGYSARSLAYCWESAQEHERGLPAEVMAAVDAVPALTGLGLLFGIPEHKVALPGGSRASQTDFWFLGGTQEKTVSVAVEGKVKEPFGQTVAEWLGSESSKDSGKPKRLSALRETLGISDETGLGAVRYQLLHRAASAILEARRFHATDALMLVHSFGGSTNFDQYREFTGLFGDERRSTGIFTARQLGNIVLHLGWVVGDERWLAA